VFPDAMKLALVFLLLKKPNIDPKILSNLLPIFPFYRSSLSGLLNNCMHN
jgi:hypothetical protein